MVPTNQIILIQRDPIGCMRSSILNLADAEIIDLGHATLLLGLIDDHTTMPNEPSDDSSRQTAGRTWLSSWTNMHSPIHSPFLPRFYTISQWSSVIIDFKISFHEQERRTSPYPHFSVAGIPFFPICLFPQGKFVTSIRRNWQFYFGHPSRFCCGHSVFLFQLLFCHSPVLPEEEIPDV